MKCTSMVGVIVTALLVEAGVALAQAAAPSRSDLSQNAALLYWQAIALMPDKDEAVWEQLQPWQRGPALAADAPAPAPEFIQQPAPVYKLAQRAAAMERCEWAIDYSEGFETTMPHLYKMSQLARLTIARASWLLQEGKPREAAELTIVVMRMGRHVGQDATLLEMLIGYGLERVGIDWLATNALLLPADIRQFVLAQLDQLPPNATTAEALAKDKAVIMPWLRRETVAGRLAAAIGLEDEPPLPALKPIGNAESQRRMLDGIEALFDEAILMLRKPYQEWKELPPFENRVAESGNLVAQILLPSFDGARHQEADMDATRAMLRAGLVWLDRNPRAFGKIGDPFGDGPFLLEQREDGFILRSMLRSTLNDGAPAQLSFGAVAEKDE